MIAVDSVVGFTSGVASVTLLSLITWPAMKERVRMNPAKNPQNFTTRHLTTQPVTLAHAV